MNGYNHNGGPDLADEAANPYGVDGFVKIARAMRFHPYVGCGHPVKPADPDRGHAWSRHEAWEDLICECRYRDGHVMNKGRLMEIKPGQLLGAVSWLGNRWNWTPKTVRGFLDKLEELGMIERSIPQFCHDQTGRNCGDRVAGEKGNLTNIISVCNFTTYQTVHGDEGRPIKVQEGRPEGEQRASEGQHLNKGIREEKNNILSLELPEQQTVTPKTKAQQAFAEFWNMYPAGPPGRKSNKPGTEALFVSLVTGRNGPTVQTIMDGLNRYVDSHPDKQFIPGPHKWLKQAKWLDTYKVNGFISQPAFTDDYYDRVRRERLEREAMEAANAAAGR